MSGVLVRSIVLCRIGPFCSGGRIDFPSIDALTATPNPYDSSAASVSGGGMGLLPWYVRPVAMDNSAYIGAAGASGNGSSVSHAVSASSVPANASAGAAASPAGAVDTAADAFPADSAPSSG